MVVKVVCLREALASRDTSLCQNPGLRLRGDEGEGSRGGKMRIRMIGVREEGEE